MKNSPAEITVSLLHIDLMRDAVNKEVDPIDCIPLYISRERSAGGLLRLKVSLDGNLEAQGPGQCGNASGSDTPLLVQLDCTNIFLVLDYFKKKSLTEDEASDQAAKTSKWYGVVDGSHSLDAILLLRVENPVTWGAFKWFVAVIKRGRSIQEYTQLSIMQNERHKSN